MRPAGRGRAAPTRPSEALADDQLLLGTKAVRVDGVHVVHRAIRAVTMETGGRQRRQRNDRPRSMPGEGNAPQFFFFFFFDGVKLWRVVSLFAPG